MPSLGALKPFAIPGSLHFLDAALGIALIAAYCWPSHRRLVSMCVAVLLLIYLVLALPATARALAASLPPVASTRQAAGSIDTLVVLAGDNEAGRVREAVRLFADIAPPVVWLLAAAPMKDELIAAGVPATVIAIDDGGPNTRSQLARIAEGRGTPLGRTLLVASRLQMPRVIALAEHMGLTMSFAPSPPDHPVIPTGAAAYVPHLWSLALSRDAVYERLAIGYYRFRGWL